MALLCRPLFGSDCEGQMTDSVEFKRRQQAALKAARENKHGSILDGLSLSDDPSSDDENGAGRKPLRPCPLCDKGMYQGLFGKSECAECHGTGFELDDPIEVIKALLAGGKKLRLQFKALTRQANEFKAMWAKEEIELRQGRLFAEKHHSRFD